MSPFPRGKPAPQPWDAFAAKIMRSSQLVMNRPTDSAYYSAVRCDIGLMNLRSDILTILRFLDPTLRPDIP